VTRLIGSSVTSPVWKATDLEAAVAGLRGEVKFAVPLREYTSFRIGGPADVLVMPVDVADVAQLVRQAKARGLPLVVLGGTNVLIRDGGIRGIVVSLAKMTAIVEEADHVLYAEGGVGMPMLLKHAASRGLSGLEWAAGIPGTVAGCVVMNAGTRLGEMKDCLKGVQLVDSAGRIVEVPASAIRFGYRQAELPPGIVVGVRVKLKPAPKDWIQATVKEYLHYRKTTQPLILPNAGCVFKNPPRDTAGRLIEAVGLKGARIGDAQVSPLHANFIVNLGQATAADVIALIRKVRQTVEERTGERLELEVKIVGEP
jgi:UDP-N-acetylmuramate dehydrogenase